MHAPDRQFSEEQSRQIAAVIREELARRRISRQQLAEQARLSISTLEKALGGRRPFTRATTVRLEEALGGRRPFTLATTVRLEQPLGVPLRKGPDDTAASANGEIAPDSLGAYSR